MTPDRMERAIEFLLENYARFTVTVERMSEKVDTLTGTVHELSIQAAADRLEMHASFEKLIQANETTRALILEAIHALSERIVDVATTTGYRASDLEGRVAHVGRRLARRPKKP